MDKESFRKIEKLLASDKPGELRMGLQLVKSEISRVGSEDAKPLLEMVSSVFYIDPLDRPDLVPLLDEAITLVVGFGGWVIPILVKQLEAGDFKAQVAISHALGRIGADAIGPLMKEYEATTDLAQRAFILYALGKIKSPKIVEALNLVIEAAESDDGELRDTGTRAIGKLAESIPPEKMPQNTLQQLIKQLQVNLGNENSAIRAKAVRSFGKLAKHGHMSDAERRQLKTTLIHIVGRDEHFDWDRAYLVRKEAEEALDYV
jgi:HEAT repeat protein